MIDGERLNALDRWRRMLAAVDAVNAECGRLPSADSWQHRAARFDRVGRQRQNEDPALPALRARIRRGDVALDIGAGAGRHAVPLAAQAARVVAVEPSAAMRARLEARLAEEHVRNVTVIPEAWPLADPVACDVAYSSHVLYGVLDIVAFVTAMTRSARRECVLVLGQRPPADAISDLWRRVHGREYPPRPGAREAFNVLREFGYAASFDVLPGSEREMSISDSTEDIDEMCYRLGIPADDGGRERTRNALADFRSPAADGGYVLGTVSPLVLIAWPGTNARIDPSHRSTVT